MPPWRLSTTNAQAPSEVESNSSGVKFGTVLAARKNTQRPSEMERQLRTRCQKLRVVEKLQGAHFLVTQVSLAVRVYYPEDVNHFEDKLQKDRPTKADDIQKLLRQIHGDGDESDEDIDGLKAFRNSFKYTAVICITPQEKSRDCLDRPDSFVHRVQRVMAFNGLEDKRSRVVIVPSSMSAVEVLCRISDALRPERSEKKKRYFKMQSDRLYVPDGSGAITKNSGAADRVTEVFREWAQQHGLPSGEVDVLISFLETLGAIVTASDDDLRDIPVEKKTKAALHLFFGSKGSVDSHMDAANTSSIHDIAAGKSPADGILVNSHHRLSPLGPTPHPIATLRSSDPLMPAPLGAFPSGQTQPFYYAEHAHRSSLSAAPGNLASGFNRNGATHYQSRAPGEVIAGTYGNEHGDIRTGMEQLGAMVHHDMAPRQLQTDFGQASVNRTGGILQPRQQVHSTFAQPSYSQTTTTDILLGGGKQGCYSAAGGGGAAHLSHLSYYYSTSFPSFRGLLHPQQVHRQPLPSYHHPSQYYAQQKQQEHHLQSYQQQKLAGGRTAHSVLPPNYAGNRGLGYAGQRRSI